eukprot:3403768-Prymnesium_polylepis.1
MLRADLPRSARCPGGQCLGSSAGSDLRIDGGGALLHGRALSICLREEALHGRRRRRCRAGVIFIIIHRRAVDARGFASEFCQPLRAMFLRVEPPQCECEERSIPWAFAFT